MRPISSALLAKLSQRWQADATDSKPNLKLIATQSSVNTLITEPIHSGIAAAYGDVALRQLPGELAPSYAYAICVDSGVAKVYGRALPADYEQAWVYLWTLGAAIDVAIEYNGTWQITNTRNYYMLITEETPWIFWVDVSEVLWAQHWQDTSTKVQLDTGVSGISACRAWQSIITPTDDQGLIVAYIKDGKAWYRAYCLEVTGTPAWEAALQITALGSAVTTIDVFRTNDYRVGFVAETGAGMQYVLSARQYAGGSFRPEFFSIMPTQIAFGIITIDYHQTVETDHITAQPSTPFARMFDDPAPAVSVVSVTRTGLRDLDLALNYPLIADPVYSSLVPYVTVSPSQAIDAAYVANGALHVTLSVDTTHNIGLTFTVSFCPLAAFKSGGKTYPLSGTLTAPAEVVTHQTKTAGNFTMQGSSAAVALIPIIYHQAKATESLTAQGSSLTLALTQTGTIPI